MKNAIPFNCFREMCGNYKATGKKKGEKGCFCAAANKKPRRVAGFLSESGCLKNQDALRFGVSISGSALSS